MRILLSILAVMNLFFVVHGIVRVITGDVFGMVAILFNGIAFALCLFVLRLSNEEGQGE